MKKILFATILALTHGGISYAYDLQSFIKDTASDTKELYKGRPEFRGAYYYDFLAYGNQKSKVGTSMPIIAWKFITVDPGFIYTPDRSGNQGEFGLGFSLRPGRIPLGGGLLLEDFIDLFPKPEWLKRFYVGPYFSHNLTTGKFGLGATSGVKF